MYKLPCKIYRIYCIWFIVVIGFVLYQQHSSFLPFYQRNGLSIFHSSLSPETELYPAPESLKPVSSVSKNRYIRFLKNSYLLSLNTWSELSWKNDLSPLFETELSPVSETELSSVPESLKPNYLLSLKIAISCPWKITLTPFLET